METTINQRLKKLRQHLGLNQEEMAKVLNVGQANVSAMELKSAIMPHHIETLHQKFKVSKYWLIEGKGEMFLSEEKKTPVEAQNWKEEAYLEVKSKNTILEDSVKNLQRELDRAWAMVQHFSGGKIPNFNLAFDKAGLSLLIAESRSSEARLRYN